MQTTSSISFNYNLLHDICEADSMLSKAGRHESICRLLNIINDHGLQDFVGIRLLHKHNSIDENEIMVENSEINDGELLLITRPISNDKNHNIFPNSWQLTGTEFLPSEFSSGHLLSRVDINPSTKPEFFKQFGDTLELLNVAHILGPAVNCGDFVESKRGSEDVILVELTAINERANVVKYENRKDVDFTSMIETSWSMSSKDGDILESEIAATKSCKRVCPSVQNPPVHQGTYTHVHKPS